MGDLTAAGWVTVAVLGKTRGNRGEITAWALSSKPERYQALDEVYLFGSADPNRRADTPIPGAIEASPGNGAGSTIPMVNGLAAAPHRPAGKPTQARMPVLHGNGERFEVESAWFHLEMLVFKFRGVDTISDAERLNGLEVRIPMSQRTVLDPGEFFQSDLIGCEVVDRPTGESLGRVSDWQDSGGPGLLVVEGDLLIPFARAICVTIDPAARRIEVELPEGLRDLNRQDSNRP